MREQDGCPTPGSNTSSQVPLAADEEPDVLEASPLSYKKKVALPQIAVQAESHYVQLPPQQTNYLSYQEYRGCG